MMNEDEPKQKSPFGGKQFVKNDPRINRQGAPAFQQFRKEAQAIGDELIPGADGEQITRREALLRSWLNSRNPKLQELFAFYAWGKPADRLELEKLDPQENSILILHYAHERKEDWSYELPNIKRQRQQQQQQQQQQLTP
jgi:hypothetical protein